MTPLETAEWLLDEIARWRDRAVVGGKVRIIDVSKHQGTIDWARVANDGIHGAIVKLTEGQNYVDPKARTNVDGARSAGLVVGGYHFSRINTGTDATRDAQLEVGDFLRTASELGPLEPGLLALDVELGGIRKKKKRYVREWLSAASDTFWQIMGRRPLVYTGRTTWKYKLGRDDEFAELPLWLVDYRNGAKPKRTIPGWSWKLWQHSHRGQIDGIRGSVDMNVWHGDRASFDAYLRGDVTAPINVT